MNEQNIFNLKTKNDDLYLGIPYANAVNIIEEANFKLLLNNDHTNYFGAKNYRLYYHEKSGSILKVESDSLKNDNKLNDATIYTQILYNHKKELRNKVIKIQGSGADAPTGYGTWISYKHTSFRDGGFVSFLDNLQELYDIYPQTFYKDKPVSTIHLSESLFLQNYKESNSRLVTKKINSFLQTISPKLSPFFQHNEITNQPLLHWNELLSKNIVVQNLEELSKEDTQIVATYKKIIEATEPLNINELKPEKNTSIGINILHLLPFISNKKNMNSVLNYINTSYPNQLINKLLNSPDYFGETPFFTALKGIKSIYPLEQNENNESLLLYYSRTFQNSIHTFNDKGSIANIISESTFDRNLKLFSLVKDTQLEWWHIWHKKDSPNTPTEKILHSVSSPEDVVNYVAQKLPEGYRVEAYEDYHRHVKEQLNKVIKTPTNINKTYKI